MNAKLIVALLCLAPVATSMEAIAQEPPVAEAKSPIVHDQMKQMGGQLLLSLFEQLVQGKPKLATATPEDAATSADAPATIDEPVVEREAAAAQPKDDVSPTRYVKRSKRPD